MSVEYGFLALAALLAGFIDAVAGGGGLVQVPALFAVLPGEAPARLFGTNKVAGIFGTASAALRYGRQVKLVWSWLLPATLAALVFSWFGAAAVAWLPKALLRPLVLALLIAVTAYSVRQREFGLLPAAGWVSERARPGWAVVIGAALGFYDGFFGPGTGSFLIFLFVRVFGEDFLRASAAAKVVNVASNAGALLFFAPHAQVLWPLALAMAAFNMLGATIGSRMAIARGSRFVRVVFLIVSSALICRIAWDMWRS